MAVKLRRGASLASCSAALKWVVERWVQGGWEVVGCVGVEDRETALQLCLLQHAAFLATGMEACTHLLWLLDERVVDAPQPADDVRCNG